jgi:hypothetical protein
VKHDPLSFCCARFSLGEFEHNCGNASPSLFCRNREPAELSCGTGEDQSAGSNYLIIFNCDQMQALWVSAVNLVAAWNALFVAEDSLAQTHSCSEFFRVPDSPHLNCLGCLLFG